MSDKLQNDHPVLLLPVRLETRFLDNNLWVRIYPDQMFVDAHDSRLTQAELEAGQRYRAQVSNSGDEGDQRSAWRELARRCGPERAAWIAQTVKRVDERDETGLRGDDEAWTAVPRLLGLPDHFVVYAYRKDGTYIRAPKEQDEPVQIPRDLTLLGENSTWTVELDQAKADGMAVRIPLEEKDIRRRDKGEIVFSRIIVVGLRSTDATEGQRLLEEIIRSHRYSTGLGFLEYGTPTNNTQTTQSGHSETTEDREGSFETEVLGPAGWDVPPDDPRTNAYRLGRALGLVEAPQALRYLAHAGDTADAYAEEMQAALWPATGDYVLRRLLPGVVDDLQGLSDHFVDYVRGSGPLPAIRVGDQPYGILPVTDVRGWEVSDPTTFDDRLYSVLYGLYETWLAWAADPQRVPRVGGRPGDPDRDLLQILSMEPTSVSYRVRPFVDEHFVTWMRNTLRDYVFKPDSEYAALDVSPSYWAKVWAEAWQAIRDHATELWPSLADVLPSGPQQASLMGLYGWWDDKEVKAETLYDIVYALCDKDLGPSADRLFRQTLDLCTHRLDAWITSLAWKRLEAMRDEQPAGIYLGAYGYVEDLRPRDAAGSAGYVHAPSWGQAAAAAVLHNAYLTHDYNDDRIDDDDEKKPNPFRINLNSERVRRALRILEGMRQGQPLGALLGYQFERALHERRLDQYIDNFREAFPIVAHKETKPTDGESADAVAARNVVDGLALARWWQDPDHPYVDNLSEILDDEPNLQKQVENLVNSLDAVSDVLMYEGVYQAVQGNYDRAGAALEAAAGNAHPREIQSLVTPVSGKLIGHRVCLLFPPLPSHQQPAPDDAGGPRAAAEPRLAAWFSDLLGDLSQIGCHYAFQPIGDEGMVTPGEGLTLENLGISAIDVLYLSASPPSGEETEVERRIAYLAREKHPLQHDTPVTIDFARSDDFAYSMGEALELARQVLRTLGSGDPLRPGALCPPSEADSVGFAPGDVKELNERCEGALHDVCRLIPELGGEQILDLDDEPIRNASDGAGGWESITAALHRASRYGVYGAVPSAPPDPIIAAGDILRIPVPEGEKTFEYEVQPGDTLSDISQRFGTTVPKLLKVNPIQDPDLIIVGQMLRIPVPEGEQTFEYEVRPGDTLWSVARRLGTTVQDLVETNQIEEPDLEIRRRNVLAELQKRADRCQKLQQEAAPFVVTYEEPDAVTRGILEGKVIGPQSEPIPDLNLIMEGTSLEAVTDAAGVFQFTELTEREVTLRLHLAEYGAWSIQVQVGVGPVTIAVQAEPNRQIALLVDAMKVLFGPGFLVLPTFAPHNDEPYIEYEVQRGDTLWDIALRFGTTFQALARINDIVNPDLITVGQILRIPNNERLIEYQVQRGDTLSAIAQRFGTTWQVLARINDIEDEDLIIVGQILFIPNGGEITRAFAQHDLLAGVDDGEHRVRLWLQQAAPVHPSLRELEDTLMMGDAWRAGEPPLTLRVAQLPFDQDNRWLALDDDERGDYETVRDRGALSVVAAAAAPQTGPGRGRGPEATLAPRLAGLLLDQWDEFIPGDTVHTSVSFQYDGPSSQAPQSLLLAVPSQRSGTTGTWDEEGLAEIVKDTMDLAKVRAVDFDAMCAMGGEAPECPGAGLVCPALMVDTDTNQDGWARTTAEEIIGHWWEEELLPFECADFMEFEEIGEEEIVGGVEIGEGVRIYNLGSEACLYDVEVPLDSSQFMNFLYHGLPHPPPQESFEIELPVESLVARLHLTWLAPLFNYFTDEAVAACDLLGIEALNGEETQVVYKRLEQVSVRLPDHSTMKVPLFCIDIRAAGIETLRLEPRYAEYIGAILLLGRVCYGVVS